MFQSNLSEIPNVGGVCTKFVQILDAGSDGKNYTFCPYCFNHPPFSGMRKSSGCNNCTHPGCEHSQHALGVRACGSCENGILVLDPTSSPNWKLACSDSRCGSVMSIFKNAKKVGNRQPVIVISVKLEGWGAEVPLP